MKINVNGKEKDALQLMLMKPLAKQIISGTKKLEIRSFSPYYTKLLLNLNNFNKWVTQINNGKGFEKDYQIFKKRVEYIHFTNRNHDWYLDVSVKQQFVEFLTAENIRALADEFNFHDLDDYATELEKKDANDEDYELNNIFCFVIDKVIATNLEQ